MPMPMLLLLRDDELDGDIDQDLQDAIDEAIKPRKPKNCDTCVHRRELCHPLDCLIASALVGIACPDRMFGSKCRILMEHLGGETQVRAWRADGGEGDCPGWEGPEDG